MAGKVLTEEDFKKGDDSEDTSKSTPKPDEIIEGKEREEPEKKAEPSEKVEEEPQPKPSDGEPKFKHKTWDETEKARIEAERKMHEATTKASTLERELTQYRKPPEKPATILDKIDEMTDQTLEKIRMLPADSQTRDRDAGHLWARLQSDISDVKYEERRRTEDTERTTVKRIYDQATKEGLKTDEELDYFSYRYSKTDPSLSVEDRTTQAVESTKTGLGKLREGLVTKQELDKKDKDDLKVLGRGSSRTEKSEKKEDRPTTMSQQLAELNEKRKLKKDDIFR